MFDILTSTSPRVRPLRPECFNFFRISLNQNGQMWCRMFRLTWDGPEALWKTMRPSLTKTQKQRIYRWENKWGFCTPQTGEWVAEARLPVAHCQREGTRFLLETVESLEDEAPPFAVDDAWEEEIVPMGGGSYAGASMCLKGSAKDLQAWCAKHGLVVPPALLSHLGG